MWLSIRRQLPPDNTVLWRVNIFSDTKEITHSLWNPPTVPVMGQMNPLHVPSSYSLNNHFNIIRPSVLKSSKWSSSFRLPRQTPVWIAFLPHACHMSRPSYTRQVLLCFFMLHSQRIAVCSQIHIKHTYTLCGQNVEFVIVKPGGTYSDHWALKGYTHTRNQ